MDTIYVSYITGKGRGIFAKIGFKRGEVIEGAPVIVLSENPWETLNHTTLGSYYFSWGENACAIALGFGSLYNHSENPNAMAVKCIEKAVIEFTALRDITPGEEITFKYQCPIWFEISS